MNYLLLITFVIIAALCFAELPQTMSYQGVLTDNDSNPVTDGSYTVGFGIHNSVENRQDEERAQLWSETQTISVSNGQFRVILGSVTPLNLPFDEPYWLAVTVNGATMTPYSELTSVPFSFNSKNSVNADSLNGYAGSHYLNWDNLTNVPSGFSDGTDASGSVLYDAVVATSGGDYTSLEAAIAAGKKTIFVRKGTFTNTAVLNLPDNTVLVGESWTESIITGYVIYSTGRVTIKNLKITCNTGMITAVTLMSDKSIVEHVWIETSSYNALNIGDQCTVRDCNIICTYGIRTGYKCTIIFNYIFSSSQNCYFGEESRIIGNYFHTTSGIGNGAIEAYYKCIISDNIILCNNNQGNGVVAQKGCLINNNKVEGFSQGIVMIAGQDGSACSNNIVKSCGTNAFVINATANDDIGPVSLTGNISWQPGSMGFVLDAGNHVYLSNNSVYGAGSDGFFINSGQNKQLQVNGNSARYCQGKGFNFSGLTSTHEMWNIVGNQAIGNSSDGFCMYITDSTISSNLSMNNTAFGYNFPNGLQYSTFTGNNSKGNSVYGFYASGFPAITYVSVSGNVIRDGFQINGQNNKSIVSGNVLSGTNNYGNPQTNSIVDHNVQ